MINDLINIFIGKRACLHTETGSFADENVVDI